MCLCRSCMVKDVTAFPFKFRLRPGLGSGSYVPEGVLADNAALIRAASNCLAYRVQSLACKAVAVSSAQSRSSLRQHGRARNDPSKQESAQETLGKPPGPKLTFPHTSSWHLLQGAARERTMRGPEQSRAQRAQHGLINE